MRAREYPALLKALFGATNVHGALVTMPHKVTTAHLVDEIDDDGQDRRRLQRGPASADGSLLGDMFDGAGFVRGVERKGRRIAGAARAGGRLRRCRLRHRGVAGCLWRGSDGPARSGRTAAEALADRLRQHYPAIQVTTGSNDPHGYDIVVNATPLA